MTDENVAAVEPPRFVDEPARSKTVPLEWPKTIGGVLYTEVTVRRMTVADIAAFADAAQHANGTRVRFPMYSVSDAVLDELDADDGAAIEEAAQAFLPRRFRAGTA